MSNKRSVLLAATGLALGTTLIGCTPGEREAVNPLAQAAASLDKASAEAARASDAALSEGRVDEAVALAERAVQFSPQDAGYRSRLANAYLRAGRFVSADQSFGETLLLHPSDGRAALSRALTRIALGDREGALSALRATEGQIAAADHGLALALAGDPAAAVGVLGAAARQPGADARVRQNLALAHALAGQWEQARIIAAQDLPADELPARMAAWAEFARPDNARAQVPTLLGVTMAADPGRPERLALIVEPSGADTAVAAVEIAPAPEVVAPAPVAVAQAAPVAVQPTLTPAAPVLAVAPLAQPPKPAQARTAPARVAAAPKPRVMTGRYAVQLGAFSSRTRLEQAWGQAVRRHRGLAGFIPSGTAVASRGTTLHRLSVSGFATPAQAQRLCGDVRRAGGSCFVRQVAGDQPMRWAARQTRNG